ARLRAGHAARRGVRRRGSQRGLRLPRPAGQLAGRSITNFSSKRTLTARSEEKFLGSPLILGVEEAAVDGQQGLLLALAQVGVEPDRRLGRAPVALLAAGGGAPGVRGGVQEARLGQ